MLLAIAGNKVVGGVYDMHVLVNILTRDMNHRWNADTEHCCLIKAWFLELIL